MINLKNNIIKNMKKYFIIFLVFYLFSIFIIPAYSINSDIIYSDELKITITNIEQQNNQPGGFGAESNLLLISMDVIDQISSINHVSDVVSIVNYIFYNFSGNFSPNDFPDDFNRTMPPDGFPDDFNRSMPPDGFDSEDRFQDKVDYIVEGIALNSDYATNFFIPNLNIKIGDNFEKNDSNIAIIGLDAADYFNIDVGENINISGLNLIVKGIVENDEYSKYIFMNINNAQAINGLNQNEINTIYVYVDDSSYLEGVSSEIRNQFQYFRINYIGQQQGFPFNLNQDDNNLNDNNIGDNTPGFEFCLLVLCLIISIFYIKKYKKM